MTTDGKDEEFDHDYDHDHDNEKERIKHARQPLRLGGRKEDISRGDAATP